MTAPLPPGIKNLTGEPREHRDGYRSDEYPKSLHDIVAQMKAGDRRYFPFESWAVERCFRYGAGAGPFLRQCESAAEAYFLQPFTFRDGVTYREEPTTIAPRIVAVCGELELALQVRCALSRIDVVLRCGRFRLAIEVDGLTYHRLNDEQIAADYIRERRIVVAGYTLVRFTAAEAFSANEECWRQVDLIVAAHREPGQESPKAAAKSRSNPAATPVAPSL